MNDTFNTAAYGGDGWRPRDHSHQDELGEVWECCGIDSEWNTLKAVLLHRPGEELSLSAQDPNSVQMLSVLDIGRAQEEHDRMAQLYRDQGVTVHLLDPVARVRPNQMFCADLFCMTPQGAILARPASIVRSGEERVVGRRLAEIGVPILKTLTGHATFEGADLMWINEHRALLGVGLRTNIEAVRLISRLMEELGVDLLPVDMPVGTMHLMGMLRIVAQDLAIAWPRRTPHAAVRVLREAGYRVVFLPEGDEVQNRRAFNFVTLGPGRIVMVEGTPTTRDFYEGNGIECLTTPAAELARAAGAIGCLTGVLWRESIRADTRQKTSVNG